ncbi:uncharacterized protein LOC125883783 [Epinephelus fuscoguttatus]|uniref:uncharacterized protein LOC125883783 n=1 Tax=Epinephelus fuscoguttatus TaxID=293821 RepID=UPI0020D1537F|nr:uncharacterized protein LOC125883783 [Epinephelus fuscoguttatus]
MSQCCHLSCVFNVLCPQSDISPCSVVVSYFPEHINKFNPGTGSFGYSATAGSMAIRCHRGTALIIGVVVMTAGLWLAVRPSGAHEQQEQQEQQEQRALAAKQHADQHVTVQPGHDVTLRCEAGDVSILAVEWTRPDLEPQYVLFYRDGHFDTTFQHPSFTGRVELVDRELKDGDVSLTLKNVNSRDSGTYECRVKSGGSRRRKRAIIKTDPITVIHLEVRGAEKENYMDGNTESEHPVYGNIPRGHIGVAAGGVAVLLVAAAVFVAVWIYKRRTDQRSKQSSLKGSDDPFI